MADIASSDLTYSFSDLNKSFLGRAGFLCRGTISFGDGALTYPTGGISIDAAKCGVKSIRSFHILESNAIGYTFEYDVSAKKLRMFHSAGFTPAGTNSAPAFTGSALAAHGHVLHLNDADVADGATTRVNAGTNLLGAGTGSDISIASVANTAGAGGIVQITAGTPAGTVAAPAFTGTAVTAARLVELSGGSTAVEAVVLEIEIRGDYQ
jgi:hypothetical protein